MHHPEGPRAAEFLMRNLHDGRPSRVVRAGAGVLARVLRVAKAGIEEVPRVPLDVAAKERLVLVAQIEPVPEKPERQDEPALAIADRRAALLLLDQGKTLGNGETNAETPGFHVIDESHRRESVREAAAVRPHLPQVFPCTFREPSASVFPMDPPRRDGPSLLLAPPARGGAEVLSFPPPKREGASSGHPPRIDEHLVKPETTRDEVLQGRKIVAQPALAPHADAHAKIDAVVHWHVRDGYQTAIDLLTRVADHSDFASDISIRREGDDPATGERWLEEISIEIVNQQTIADAHEKAAELAARGVRRVFAIFVNENRVCEWSRARNAFVLLERDGVIEDPCFVRPMPVRAFLERAVGERETVRALVKRGGEEIQAVRDKGRREMLLEQLRFRFGQVPAATMARVEAASGEELTRLGQRVLSAATLDAVFEET